MTGATSSANGSVGYIGTTPPSNGYNTKYWRADGTWQQPMLYKDYTQTIEAFAAGNPGSRAAQYMISGIGISGYRIIASQIKSHPDSTIMNLKTFLRNDDETAVYLNVYRASGSANGFERNVIVRVLYLRVS